jgi:hypothetical protein
MSRTNLINNIRDILVPDRRPRSLVFWATDKPGQYVHNGQPFTRDQALALPSRCHIFVNRKSIGKWVEQN